MRPIVRVSGPFLIDGTEEFDGAEAAYTDTRELTFEQNIRDVTTDDGGWDAIAALENAYRRGPRKILNRVFGWKNYNHPDHQCFASVPPEAYSGADKRAVALEKWDYDVEIKAPRNFVYSAALHRAYAKSANSDDPVAFHLWSVAEGWAKADRDDGEANDVSMAVFMKFRDELVDAFPESDPPSRYYNIQDW